MADKNQIIQNLVDYPLLIIDDLGIERNSEFALEQVYNVIDSRYCKNASADHNNESGTE